MSSIDYEKHIDAIQDATGVAGGTIEAAEAAMAFVHTVHSMFVENRVLNESAPVDTSVLEVLIDELYGEIGAAALFLAQPDLAGCESVLEAAATFEPPDATKVPVFIRKGFSRLAQRVVRTREWQIAAANALATEAEQGGA